MSTSTGLKGRVQRLEERSDVRGVAGIVTPRDGTHGPEEHEHLRRQIAHLHKIGHSVVYVAHLARELCANEPLVRP